MQDFLLEFIIESFPFASIVIALHLTVLVMILTTNGKNLVTHVEHNVIKNYIKSNRLMNLNKNILKIYRNAFLKKTLPYIKHGL